MIKYKESISKTGTYRSISQSNAKNNVVTGRTCTPEYASINMLNRTRSAPICNWVQTKQMWPTLSTRSSAFIYHARVCVAMHVQLCETVHTAWPNIMWNSRPYSLDSSELEQIACSILSSSSPVAKNLTRTHLWDIALLMSQPSANCVASAGLYHVQKNYNLQMEIIQYSVMYYSVVY